MAASELPPGAALAFTTDSYVVSPIVFAGGDIGRLAVCGTVNDLAVGGAIPRWISCGLILEEGFAIDTLIDAGASPDGHPEHALVNGNFAAAEHLVKRGAPLTLATALCLNRLDDAERLFAGSTDRQRCFALVVAALHKAGYTIADQPDTRFRCHSRQSTGLSSSVGLRQPGMRGKRRRLNRVGVDRARVVRPSCRIATARTLPIPTTASRNETARQPPTNAACVPIVTEPGDTYGARIR